MKAREMMTAPAVACGPDADVAAVAQVMWECDCGVVPVVDEGGRVTGMITDRDICIALATRGRPAGELRAGELLNGRLFTCSPDDTVQTALRTMRDAKVRRLAVVDASGALQGILSINDVIRQAENGRGGGSPVSYEETMSVLQALCAHVAKEASRPVIHSSEATARRKRGRAS